MATTLTANDILDMESYEAIRAEKRQDIMALKMDLRVAIGPYATAYFENRDTVWLQVHEMLRIEKGGKEQIADELMAYNPLIPNGQNLVCTLMFEIDELEKRRKFLSKLGGVEETIFLEINGTTIRGLAEKDIDRTTADGKASAVHFVHFDISNELRATFMDAKVVMGISHESYPHMTQLTHATRKALAREFIN